MTVNLSLRPSTYARPAASAWSSSVSTSISPSGWWSSWTARPPAWGVTRQSIIKMWLAERHDRQIHSTDSTLLQAGEP